MLMLLRGGNSLVFRSFFSLVLLHMYELFALLCACMCYGMPVEVRGQLEEVGFFFFPSWGLISGTQFVRKYLCPLSHLDDRSLPYPSLPAPLSIWKQGLSQSD